MRYRVAVASTTPPTLPDPRASQWSRRALVGAAVVMAAVLVGTAWLGYASARDASRLVARGQAEALLDQIRRQLRAIDRDATAEELEAVRAELADRGVRYLAIVEPREGHRPGERPTLIEAGTPAVPVEPPPRFPAARRGGPPLMVSEAGGRLRVISPLPGGRRRDVPPAIVIELESSAAREVSDAARRSLITSCIGAAVLVLGALAAARWLAARDREAQARARERHLASLGEMSAVLAHELKNPLASLKGNAQLVAEIVDGPTRERADVVVDEAVRLERLANGLLDFVRTGNLRKQPVEPAALARAAADEVDGARIDVDAGAAPATWSMDPDRMRQVLVNVMRNAIEASPEGARVSARVWGERGALRIAVRDRGPGIPAGEEQAIFEPFRTSKTRGTGLGLAVARRIVELHGGEIRAARGDDGVGAVIDVKVPG